MSPLRPLFALGLLAAVAGCETMQPAAEPGETPPAQAAGDSCGAAALQGLLGRSVGDLDPATLPANRRVLFPGMAATMDYVPGRVNVVVGTSDRIERVYCG
jgi:hypothetical protein